MAWGTQFHNGDDGTFKDPQGVGRPFGPPFAWPHGGFGSSESTRGRPGRLGFMPVRFLVVE